MKIAIRLIIGFFILGVIYKTPQFWLALLVLLLPFYCEAPKAKPVDTMKYSTGAGGSGIFVIKEGTWDGR